VYSKEIQRFLNSSLKKEKDFAGFLENLDFEVSRLEIKDDNSRGRDVTLWTSDYSKVDEIDVINESESFFNPYSPDGHPLIIKYISAFNFCSRKHNSFGTSLIKIEDLEAETKKMNVLCESLKDRRIFPVPSEEIINFYEKKGLSSKVFDELKDGVEQFRHGKSFHSLRSDEY
jgi:hypothetical protein